MSSADGLSEVAPSQGLAVAAVVRRDPRRFVAAFAASFRHAAVTAEARHGKAAADGKIRAATAFVCASRPA